MSTVKSEKKTYKVETTAQAYLELLELRGVEYFFANPGTDFASLIDAFTLREQTGKALPRPLAVPHEIPLVAMAHGYYLATGRPQVAMVHVNVGTANGVGGLIMANRSRIPILFTAGRTPVTEEGSPASRDLFIHWGQESFDQAAMVREYVKWDYELRTPDQLENVVDRALTLAMSDPKGPVYLTLPREVMAAPLGEVEFQARLRYDLPTFHPDPKKIEEAAGLLAGARFPLIITSSLGLSKGAVEALAQLAESEAIGVISFNPEYMNLPVDHPCHLGFMPGPHLKEADVILVVDCDVPWMPNRVKPQASATVIQAGVDPLYSRYPMRGFPSDLTLQGDPALVLSGISKALEGHSGRDQGAIDKRRNLLLSKNQDMLKAWKQSATKASADRPIKAEWISYNVGKILDGDSVVVNQSDPSIKNYVGSRTGSLFNSPHAGYLGWAPGAALGIKLAEPEKTVIATVGDGSYMFSVPSASHFVSSAYQLPVLFIVYNNEGWQKVRNAVTCVHPDGWASKSEKLPLCDLKPAVHFEQFCEACGGYGERVEDPDQVGPALERALHAVKKEKRQALLNIICED